MNISDKISTKTTGRSSFSLLGSDKMKRPALCLGTHPLQAFLASLLVDVLTNS